MSLALLGAVMLQLSFRVNTATRELSLRFRNEEIDTNNAPTHNQENNLPVVHLDDDVEDDPGIWPSPRVLRQVAVDNTIIVISANCGYIEMTQNWILHVQQLQITNYIVIAQDDSVFPVLDAFAPGHVMMLNRNISTEVGGAAFSYNSEGFYKVCKQRPHIIQSILNQGYRVLYSDTDLVWVKNPLERLPSNVDYVGIVDDDVPKRKQRGVMCTALLYLQPNKNVTNMISHWTRLMDADSNAEGHDQGPWQAMLKKLKGNYSMHVLSKYEFPPGT